jgi:ATP-dependent Clp protease protease subunit
MYIRIVAMPPGEAPPEVRKAWVGLILPTLDGSASTAFVSGVLTGPRGLLSTLVGHIFGSVKRAHGYRVWAADAFEVLASHNPVAALWWIENRPHLLGPEGVLVFHADVCERCVRSEEQPLTEAEQAAAAIGLVQLLRTRSIPVTGELTEAAANKVIAHLLLLRGADASKPIVLRIDSTGGSFIGGLAIVDAAAEARDLVHTLCESRADGVAALILACGAPGQRCVGLQAQVWLGPLEARGTPSPAAADDLERMHAEFATMLVEYTGQSRDIVALDLREGRNFDASQAVVYGLADELVEPPRPE